MSTCHCLPNISDYDDADDDGDVDDGGGIEQEEQSKDVTWLTTTSAT